MVTYSGHHLSVHIQFKDFESIQDISKTSIHPLNVKYLNNSIDTMSETRRDNDDTYMRAINIDSITSGNETSTYCGIKISKEMDLLKMRKISFDRSYKNPCWRKADGRLRCLPYMYLIGVAKCGTTDLFSRITMHPDFVAPVVKEPNWLSSKRFWEHQSLDYYTAAFFSPITKTLENDKTKQKRNRLITGEASINTITGAHAWQNLGNNVGEDAPVENNPEYIYHLYNETRILINIRNPVDRLWSEYLAFSRNTVLSPEKFHSIVEKSIKLYNDCTAKRSLRSCIYDRSLWNYASLNDTEVVIYGTRPCRVIPIDIVMLQRGIYHVYIQDYQKVFRKDHILIQRLEDISKDPQTSLEHTYNFLGLRPLKKNQMQYILNANVKNSNPRGHGSVGTMLQKTQHMLYQFYKPHNEKLVELLGKQKYNYGPTGG
ncbi:hypothetical protein ACF0H5_020212 [Mactra antiquata]